MCFRDINLSMCLAELPVGERDNAIRKQPLCSENEVIGASSEPRVLSNVKEGLGKCFEKGMTEPKN